MKFIKDALRGLNFKGFEGFEVWRILYQPSESERILHIRTNWAKILYHILFKKTTIVLEENGGKILFFMFYSGRSDFERINENVYSLVDIKDRLIVTFNKRRKQISINFLWRCFLNMFQWSKQLEQTGLCYEQKKVALDYLIMNFKCAFDMQKITLKHYKLAVIFNDADTIGNYVCQYCKNRAIETASLQHGVILAPHPDIANIDFAGIELCNSISDHFLVWNNFTKYQALKAGKREENIEVCGIIRCMDVRPEVNKNNKKKFGVVLDGRYTAELNLLLVTIANKVAKDMNMKYYLKYHPSDSPHLYDHITDNDYYIGAYDKTKTIKQYAGDVDFSLIANSTVYMELVFLKHTCYRLCSDKSSLDKYKDVGIMNFSSAEHVVSLIKKGKGNSAELYDQLCTIEDVRSSYKSFFERYL